MYPPKRRNFTLQQLFSGSAIILGQVRLAARQGQGSPQGLEPPAGVRAPCRGQSIRFQLFQFFAFLVFAFPTFCFFSSVCSGFCTMRRDEGCNQGSLFFCCSSTGNINIFFGRRKILNVMSCTKTHSNTPKYPETFLFYLNFPIFKISLGIWKFINQKSL